MNKTVALLAAALLGFVAGSARADVLQVFTGNSYVSYAAVYVNNQRVGYTDMYGRIRINLPTGRYVGAIESRDGYRRFTFTIEGAQQLKRVNTV